MSGFYVSMIFFGILLVLVSLLFIALDKKKVFNFTKTFDEKKQQLTEILNDAEQMIEELNKFSDYIVNQMDLKSEELNKNIKIAEDKVLALSERAKGISGSVYVNAAANPAADGSPVQPPVTVIQTSKNTVREAVLYRTEAAEASTQAYSGSTIDMELSGDTINTEDTGPAAFRPEGPAEPAAAVKRKDKVIPLRNKYSEVLRLSQQGMGSTDIARGLNMGKGEVELIIGLRSEQLQ